MTRQTPSRHRLEHECVRGVDCRESAPGHAMSLLQQRVVAATPSKWRDAVVTAVAPDGGLRVTTVDDGSTVSVWNHARFGGSVGAGEPVALHRVYHVLAIGSGRFNVVVDDPPAADGRG